jgi:hypothetical protein
VQIDVVGDVDQFGELLLREGCFEMVVEAFNVCLVGGQTLSGVFGKVESEIVLGYLCRGDHVVLDCHAEGVPFIGRLSQEYPFQPHTSIDAVVNHILVGLLEMASKLHLLQNHENTVDPPQAF